MTKIHPEIFKIISNNLYVMLCKMYSRKVRTNVNVRIDELEVQISFCLPSLSDSSNTRDHRLKPSASIHLFKAPESSYEIFYRFFLLYLYSILFIKNELISTIAQHWLRNIMILLSLIWLLWFQYSCNKYSWNISHNLRSAAILWQWWHI